MLKTLTKFFTEKYLILLSKQNFETKSDIEYLQELLRLLKPEEFSSVIVNLNSPKVVIKSIHKNFEELLKFLIIINNTLEKSGLLYRDKIFLEEKEHDLILFTSNSKGQTLNLQKCIESLKQLLHIFCYLYLATTDKSDKENDKLNKHYLKSYIKHLCGILNELIKLQ